MLKIRLNRLGAKKSPFYRIVVADSRKAQNVPDHFPEDQKSSDQ